MHPTIAAAIAARGYTTPTPVQAAVLDPALGGRDLLVSAPTGSGKTLAFGILMGGVLLDGGRAPRPRALVVAPTRELANQVCRELAWVVGPALRLGAFTGGTAIGPDMRRLRAGVDVAVGTPGRLLDLARRGALDLAAVAVLVLDEADEMLDLGFKDELEALLGSLPRERRTLLFSATLPPEIERLATTYQRDAARVDVRAGAGHAHADIEQRAHLVRDEDRFAALVNVLVAAGDARAIVFVRTREAVTALHERLVAHGFGATAIAGDRAQSERDRALAAMREGQAQVLVATNVAARGLDLPDVELVVHADLPDSPEALTHRSGRTGRAGRKGTSVVLATPREKRKAERMLAGAGLRAHWEPPPSLETARAAGAQRLVATLLAEATGAGRHPDGDEEVAPIADRLRAALPDRALVALLLRREAARLPRPQSVRALAPEPPRPAAPRWSRAVLFRVNVGAEKNADPGWLLPLLCRRGGVTRREIGAIRIGPRSTTFEVSAEAAGAFARAAARPDPRAPEVLISPVEGLGAGRTRRDGTAPAPARKVKQR